MIQALLVSNILCLFISTEVSQSHTKGGPLRTPLGILRVNDCCAMTVPASRQRLTNSCLNVTTSVTTGIPATIFFTNAISVQDYKMKHYKVTKRPLPPNTGGPSLELRNAHKYCGRLIETLRTRDREAHGYYEAQVAEHCDAA